MNREEYIKSLIRIKGMSLKDFSDNIGMPYSTLLSMLNRTVGGASVDNVIKVCKGLGITVEDLQKHAEEQEKLIAYQGNELSESDIHILSMFQKIPDDKRKELIDKIEFLLKLDGLL